MTHNMRAVITGPGGPDVLRLVEEPAPRPGRGQARLAVHAVGVAFADVYARMGIYPGAPSPPFTPGFDLVGTVDEVGKGVTGIEPGQRYAAIVERGGSARWVCVPASSLVPVPTGVRDEEAVAVLLNYVTAHQMLWRLGRVRPGDAVFAHALAGGVGTAILDLARHGQLRVVGTASASKHALVRELGGDPIDYRTEDVVARARDRQPGGYAVVLDAIGGAGLCRSHRLVAPGGALVVYGFQSGARPSGGAWPTLTRTVVLSLAPGRRTRFYAIMRFAQQNPGVREADMALMLGRLGRGELRPVIASVLPLSQIAHAHRLLESGEARGKIILTMER